MSAVSNLGLRPSGLSLDRNLSLYAIPAVWALAFLPHTVKVILLGDRFNNLKPRDPIQYKATDSTSFKETIARLGSLHVNGLENLPLYFGTILAANYAHLPPRILSTYALTLITTRLAFIASYLGMSSEGNSWIRTGTYFAGVIPSLWVLWKSAERVAERY